MNETILTLITFIIALSIGIFVGKLLFSANFKSEKASLEEKINGLISQIEQSKNQTQLVVQEREALRKEKEVLIIQLSKKETDFENLWERNKEQKQEVEQLQEKFTKEFENLANKILEEKTTKFTEQNKEHLKNILAPLQEKITHFEKKVEDTHKESIDYHAALRQQILGLREMNIQMSKETINLTKALKGDSKMQ
ncbi:DNA recombination protein RmuC, partial [Flavobacterium croceum]|uniref:DNA recombination protein RmuC n=1 Tax=Flavobacterium croceum TaxID=370975 RepID=UPI0024A8A749